MKQYNFRVFQCFYRKFRKGRGETESVGQGWVREQTVGNNNTGNSCDIYTVAQLESMKR